MRYVWMMAVAMTGVSASYAGESAEGYVLYNSLNSSTSYMIDTDGSIVHTWHGADRPASTPYLYQGGTIYRPTKINDPSMNGGAVGGRVQTIDVNDDVLWDFTYSDYDNQPHHDIAVLPNGNVLMICWNRRSNSQAVAMGRTGLNGELWPLKIVEVEPTGPTTGEIVWSWNLWDHMIQDVDPAKPNYGVVSEHPELFDINFGSTHGQGGDWIHANGLDYNAELDQIIVSSHFTMEFYIIDHSTTTEEAAGHTGGNSGMGGDILYRWGNPTSYDRGNSNDQYFYVLHGVNWIDEGLPGAGNIIVFNNGDRSGSSNDYSNVAEIVPPLNDDGTYDISASDAFGPASPVWEYENNPSFYANHLSGCFRLPNGNTLATEGTTGTLLEVTTKGDVVWQHSLSGQLAKATWYPTDILEPPNECPTDINGDGVTNTPDLLAVLAAWGEKGDLDADVNGDGRVDVGDLLAILGAFGPC